MASGYLHFNNIDMLQPDISARRNQRGHVFEGIPQPGERVDDAPENAKRVRRPSVRLASNLKVDFVRMFPFC